MRRHRDISILAILLLFTVCSCSIEDDRKPITSQISVAVPMMHQPSGLHPVPGVAPVIELQTVEHFPTLCYRIQHSKNERAAGRVHITLGDAVSTTAPCAQAFGPACAIIPIDSTASHYRVTLTLRDSVDIYEIKIEPERIRLIPIELHFTFPADSVCMR